VSVTTVDHPLAQELLTTLRDEATPAYGFRDALDRLAALLSFEATRTLPMRKVSITTPIGPATGLRIASNPVLVPVLRAGLGMLPAAQRLLPEALVAFVGMSRDELSREPHRYLASLPAEVEGGHVMVLEPMIATGGSLLDVLNLVKEAGAASVVVCVVLAAPEGLKRVVEAHPDVDIVVAAVDERLDERAYVVPGLGDAGDRQFGVARG
jgi:uracil phosphoribosyltransferase